MNESLAEPSLFPFQSLFSPHSSPSNMTQPDEQTKERPQPAPSIENRHAPSHDYVEKGFRKFYQRSLDSPAVGSNDSSPTTTISTVDDSSATEPSPGSSPESPPPSSLAGGMLRPRTADDSRPFFELQKQPPPRKGRNLKNLAVNTSRNPAKGLSTASLPLPSANNELLAADSPAFVKPHTPSKRKPSNLGLTLLTPGINKAPTNEIKLAVPPTPSFAQSNTLRHFQSAPSLPLESEQSAAANDYQTVHIISNLETILSPTHREFSFDEEEEQNFDIPLSQEEKPEAYPHGPICVYEPYIDLYLEPTVEQAREYDVIMNVANEVRNPFITVGSDLLEEPELRIDGGGGIQYAPKRDRVPYKTLDVTAQSGSSPTTPKATSLEPEFSAQPTESHGAKEPEYIHVKWEHNSDIVPDLLPLVKLMDEKVMEGRRILIHCQCGVSRSASLVVAYGLYKDPSLSVQEAYDAVKKRSKWIGPNMNLIMQLQEFRTSLTRGGLLSSNRGVTPITPSSALSEWRGPFATISADSSISQSTITAPLIKTQTAEPLPVLISGPSSAPSGTISTPNPDLLLPRARAISAAVSSGKSVTTFVNPSGRLVPILKVPEADLPVSAAGGENTLREEEASHGATLAKPLGLGKKLSIEDFAMTSLQPSPDVDSADSFGLMSPSSTEFSTSPFERSALLANLGMGPIGKQEDLGPRRSISLRSRHLQPRGGHLTVNGSNPGSKLRGKISSPDLGEQRRLQEMQAEIEASLQSRATNSSTSTSVDDLLMSPRATEFTQNPFALAMGDALEGTPPKAPESDPRSPAIQGGSPITRSIFDVL